MRKIYKYPVKAGSFTLEMPAGAQPLRCMVQGEGGQPQLWALVDPAKEPKAFRFVTYGTGHDIPEEDILKLTFVDTFMLENGDLVFHLFWRHHDRRCEVCNRNSGDADRCEICL